MRLNLAAFYRDERRAWGKAAGVRDSVLRMAMKYAARQDFPGLSDDEVAELQTLAAEILFSRPVYDPLGEVQA